MIAKLVNLDPAGCGPKTRPDAHSPAFVQLLRLTLARSSFGGLGGGGKMGLRCIMRPPPALAEHWIKRSLCSGA